jgi:WD40 repeat protein
MSGRIALIVSFILGAALPVPAAESEKRDNGAPKQAGIRSIQRIDLNDGTLRSVVFSTDGTSLAAGGERCVHLRDVKTGACKHRLEGHTKEVRSVAYSPNGKQLASGSSDRTIRLWDVDSGKLAKVFEGGDAPDPQGPIQHVTFCPDGKVLVSCTAGQNVTLWDVDTGLWNHIVRTTHLGAGCSCVAVASDGKHCAVAGTRNRREFAGQVSYYRVNAGFQLLWNSEHDGELPATYVAFAPNGAKLLSCGHDNAVRICDSKEGCLSQKLLGPEGHKVMQAALFTPDGSRVVAVTREGALRLWTAGSGELRASIKASEKSVLGLALSPDGTTVATLRRGRSHSALGVEPKN